MKKILRKIILFLIIAIATGIVLYFSLKDNYTVIIDTILHINKIWLGIAFLLFFTYYFLKSYVTRNFATEFNSDYSLKDAFRMTTETSFFHAVTPFATGGQPYEIYSLMKHNINIIDATNISIESFIVYQIALVFLGAVSIICNHFFHILNSNLLKNFLTLGFLINFLVIVVLFWITLSKKTEKNIIYKIIDVLAKMKIVKNKEENKEKLKKYYDLPYDEPCMHEFVLSGERQKHESGVSTLNIAKALMDGNTHPPTVYFPLIVHEAIMIEPTESENKEILDEFVDTMILIAQESKTNPEKILSAPHTTPVKKIDEVTAARHPDLKYIKEI